MNKLEIYGVLLLMIIGTNIGCFAWGYHKAKDAAVDKVLADNNAALQKMLTAGDRITTSVNAAADVADAATKRLNAGADYVTAKYSKLPNIVVDTKGCVDIGPNFRMRWDAATAVSNGPVEVSPGSTNVAVQPGAVPPAR